MGDGIRSEGAKGKLKVDVVRRVGEIAEVARDGDGESFFAYLKVYRAVEAFPDEEIDREFHNRRSVPVVGDPSEVLGVRRASVGLQS
jgi:hypothetical protein